MGGAYRGDDEATIARTLAQGGQFLILEADGQVAGTSWLTDDGRRIYLHHFGILPAYQGRGWSHPLLEASLAWVKSKGMQVKLEVHRENHRALRLYRKRGFEPLGGYDVLIIRSMDTL